MIEFEMKFQVSHSSIKPQLAKIDSAELLKIDFNNDIYFEHPVKDYASTDEALRVRSTSAKTKITYKGPKIDTRSKSREEIDLTVEDERIVDLLKKLDFEVAGEVKKERETWKVGEIMLTFDTVQDLGEFVEIEIVASSESNKDIILEKMASFVTSLGLDPNNQILDSYLELVLDKQTE